MAKLSLGSRCATALTGRRSECDVLDRLIEAVGAGESRALVVRGEPGVGKTALLEYVVEQASGFRVVRAAGVQSEMELAFAGLHQLLASMLDRLDGLPAPQSEALRTAFGLASGTAPGSLLRRSRRTEPAFRRGGGAAAPLRGGRRAVARPRLGRCPRLRCAPPGSGVGRLDLRGARQSAMISPGCRSLSSGG